MPMNGVQDHVKINLNQNLWGLVVGFAALGASEHFNLETLYYLSCVVSGIMLLSIAFTTLAYTIDYWKNKFRNRQGAAK